MTDPLDRQLDDAARTLRDATRTREDPRSAGTRARILVSHRAARSRAAQASVWLLAAAALLVVFGGSTAWAYWTGRIGSGPRDVRPAPTQPAPERPREPSHARGSSVSGTSAPVVAPPVVVPAVVAPPPPATGERSAESTPAQRPTPEPRVEEITDPTERRVYAEAHALHFEQHDDARAIDAWARYLAAYPRGRFALEARYNRALCLVRAGREDEAREALAPFALGTHDGYRQREAREILEALDAR